MQRNWALLAACLIFVAVGVIEIVQGRYKDLLATQDLRFQSLSWQTPARWRYELRNILDEPVGRAECSLARQGEIYQLHCLIDQQAFEAHMGSSHYYSDEHQREYTASWAAEDGHLVAFASAGVKNFDRQVFVQQLAGDELHLTVSDSQGLNDELRFPDDALMADEWPWRLMALDFKAGNLWQSRFVWPLNWSAEAQKSIPQAESVVVSVLGIEPLSTPAGNFVAWRVGVGNLTAWYDTQPPHMLVSYDNGMVRFVLAEKPE